MTKYLGLLMLTFVAPLHASSALESHIGYCQTLTSDQQRLACFDRIKLTTQAPEAKPVTAAPAAAPAVISPVSVVPAVAAQAAAEFGLEHKKEAPEEQKDTLILKLTKLSKTAHGELIFTFENGQVWRQVSKETFIASAGQSYQLQRGALNSFFLSKEGQARKTRVRRDK